MARRVSLLLVVAACLCLRPAPVFTQQTPPAVDAALATAFVTGDAPAREALIRTHPDILEAAFTAFLNAEGQRQRNARNLDGARQYHGAALYIGEQHDRPAAAVGAMNGLSAVAAAQDDYTTAMQLAERALALAERANVIAGQQQSWFNIGGLQRDNGDLDKSTASMARAIELAKQMNNPLLVGRALQTLGGVERQQGNNAKALDTYLQALTFKADGKATPADFLSTYSSIGILYSDQGELDVALEYFKKAIDGMNGELTVAVAGVYNNIGLIQRARRQYDEARKTYATALPIAQKAQSVGLEATMLFNLAQIEWHEDQLDKAETLFRQSLALRERAGPRTGLIESLDSLTELLTERGRYDEAVALGERAVRMSAESGMLDELWRTRVSIGTTYQRLKRYDEARVSFDKGIETLENMQTLASLGNGEAHAIFEKLTPYYELAELNVEVGRPFEGLVAIDRARARTLLGILSTSKAPARNFSPAEREREQALTNNVLQASERLEAERAKASPDRARLSTLEAGLTASRAARDAYITGLFAQRPGLQLSSGRTANLTAAQLAAVLSPGTAIVSFVLEDHASWVYVATAGPQGPTVTAHALPKGNDRMLSTTATFIEQVASRNLGFNDSARSAYDLLLAPAEARLRGITNLVIIPDGPLWRLPFQALKTPRGTFLIEEKSVSYAPSVAALVTLEERRRARKTSTPSLLALGDPMLPPQQIPSAVSGPKRSEVLARLPEAGREVAALRALYGASRSTILTDAAASEAALRARASRATVLHLATHGVLDNKSPMYSHLVLAPGAGASANDDGKLEAWELMEMGLTADVAVLSACQTAGAGPGFGEGLMGLSWSLFASGASTAVVSQWEVDSASTTALMLVFHRQLLASKLGDGASAHALQQASLSLLKQPAYRHPFYWAGFMTIGAK